MLEKIFVITVNYKNAPTNVRAQYAIDEEKTLAFLEELKEGGIPEAVYLSTCNRCEVYGVGDDQLALRAFARLGQESKEDIKKYAMVFEGEDALRHLFRVISGIESMVIGEDEVLGQMKTAFAFSRDAGYTDYTLRTVFQAAITAAKKIKTDTMLSKSSISVATLAADKARKFKSGEKTVLVIGASGDTGKKLTKNLLSFPECRVYGTQRNVHVAEDKLHVIPYDDRYQLMEEADVIISATKGPHLTVTKQALLDLSLSEKQRLFIDLAVPRDIDEDVMELPGARLITIADIERLAKENNDLKMAEVERAELMIEDALDELKKILSFHDFLPTFQKIEGHEILDFKHFVYHYRDTATAEEFASFLAVLTRMEADFED